MNYLKPACLMMLALFAQQTFAANATCNSQAPINGVVTGIRSGDGVEGSNDALSVYFSIDEGPWIRTSFNTDSTSGVEELEMLKHAMLTRLPLKVGCNKSNPALAQTFSLEVPTP